MRYLSAVPAYGRDYKTKAQVLAAWAEGKDFLIQDMMESGYVNRNDLPNDVTLHVRYDNLRKVTPIRGKI